MTSWPDIFSSFRIFHPSRKKIFHYFLSKQIPEHGHSSANSLLRKNPLNSHSLMFEQWTIAWILFSSFLLSQWPRLYKQLPLPSLNNYFPSKRSFLSRLWFWRKTRGMTGHFDADPILSHTSCKTRTRQSQIPRRLLTQLSEQLGFRETWSLRLLPLQSSSAWGAFI